MPQSADCPAASSREIMVLGAVTLLICVLYFPLLFHEPLLGRDDHTMLAALRAAIDMGYGQALWEGKTLDVQPMRDLSIWADIQVEALTGVRIFHATQLLIWLASGFIVHAILRTLGATPRVRTGLACLFLLHPVSISAVCWFAARKHLLACLFLSGATLRVVRWSRGVERPWREGLVTSGLYACAMASQPLGLFWPLWAVWFTRTRVATASRQLWMTLGTCLVPVFVITAWMNHRYFTYFYPLRYGGPKVVDGDLVSRCLALGRYFAQIVAPVSLPTTGYTRGSPLNIVGLIGFALVTLALLRRNSGRPRAAWLGLYVLSLVPVTLIMTNIFGSDTYALMPLMGMCCLLGDPACGLLSRVELHRPRLLLWAMGLVGLVFSLTIFVHTDDWLDDSHFWRASYSEAPTPDNMIHVAFYDLKENDVDEALALAQQVYAVAPGHRNLHLVLPEAVFRSARLDSSDKLRILHDKRVPGPWPMYYEALLYAQGGDFDRAWGVMQQSLENPTQFGDRAEQAVATATLLCQRAQKSGCDALSTQAAGQIAGRAWDVERFDAAIRGPSPW